MTKKLDIKFHFLFV